VPSLNLRLLKHLRCTARSVLPTLLQGMGLQQSNGAKNRGDRLVGCPGCSSAALLTLQELVSNIQQAL